MKFLLVLQFMFMPILIFAHGENKAGPNGGLIQMPGNFHTEVVKDKDGTIRVYLLDIEFKNPIIKNSKVELTVKGETNTEKLTCMEMEDHFHCSAIQKIKKGSLIVLANRDGQQGIEAKYKLPLRMLGKVKPMQSGGTNKPAANPHQHH